MSSIRSLKQEVYRLKKRLYNQRCCYEEKLKNCGSSEEQAVYYQRAWLNQTVSYEDNDSGFRRINGGNDHNETIPENALIQAVSPDTVNNRKDYLKYNNIWGHKFRYTGEFGGYYDEADGNYYDANGVLSDRATEFPDLSTPARWMVFDHLTGFTVPNERGGAVSWDAWVVEVPTYQYFLYGSPGDYFIPSREETALVRNIDENEEFGQFVGSGNRPIFTWSQGIAWTGTTRSTNTIQAMTYLVNIAGGSLSAATKSTTGANRWGWTEFDSGEVIQT